MGHARRIVGILLVSVCSAVGLGAVGAPAGAATKDPVVIVAGTFAGQGLANVYYAPLAARLRADGYQAFIFGLPDSGLGDARDAAAALNTFVDGVRAQTGAAKVDLIGHSQGGMVARYYVKYLGGANEVDSLVNLAAVNYGTAVANLAKLLGLGNCIGVVSCQQMSIGSSFLADLNAGDDTIGNVSYTNFGTVNDTVIVPYTNSFLANDGNNTNVTIQSQCWLRYVDHIGIALDGTVYSGIQDALAHRAISLSCFAL
ncbi:MAG: esterase/lipase family protein [Acidimicrobiia bacterium]